MSEESLPTQRYTLPEFGKISKLGRTTIYERISEGRLSVVKDGRRVFVTRAEAERYLAACENA